MQNEAQQGASMKLTQEQIEKAAQVAFSRYNECRGFRDRSTITTWAASTEAVAPLLQYAPTEPGAPLSDAEKEQLRVPLGAWMSERLETRHLYLAIDTVLARRNVRTEAPAPCVCGHPHWGGTGPCEVCNSCTYTPSAVVDAGLVERMLDAFNDVAGDTLGGEAAMTAALHVAADALLGPVTDDDYECMFMAMNAVNKEPGKAMRGMEVFNAILADRRALLLAPAKSAEEEQCEHVAKILEQAGLGVNAPMRATEIIAVLGPWLKQEAAK